MSEWKVSEMRCWARLRIAWHALGGDKDKAALRNLMDALLAEIVSSVTPVNNEKKSQR